MRDLTMENNLLLSAMMSVIQLSTAIVNCRYNNNVIKCAVLMFVFITMVFVEAAPKRTRNGDYNHCHKGAISPRDPFFLLGSPIVLNCTSKLPSFNLTFLYGSKSTEVDPQYIRIVNATTITMTLPAVSEETIHEYKASMSYRCVDKKDPHNINCISNTHVKVDYYPVAPIDLQCRIPGFNTMHCTWDLAVNYRNNISVKCKYAKSYTRSALEFESDIGGFEKCPEMKQNGCIWNEDNFPDGDIYYIALSVTNKLKNVTVQGGNYTRHGTPCYKIMKYDIAEPFPVKMHNLYFDVQGWSKGNRCGTLNWWPPSNFTTHNLIFNITRTSDCDLHKTYKKFFKKNYEDPILVNITICDLNPHTVYKVCVKSRYMEDNVEKGYWSEPSCISKQTPPAVPEVSPDESSLLYEIQNTDTSVIYWKPLTSCELHSPPQEAFYEISVGGKNVKQSSQHFRSNIQISTNESTFVTIETVNNVGRSRKAAILNIPQESERPKPSKLIIQYDPLTPNCKNVSATIDSSEGMTANVSHRLVVCDGSDNCEHALEIVDMPHGVMKYAFPSDHCYGNYRYGLVTRSLGLDKGDWLDTGIDWVKCKYQLGKVPDELQQANVSEQLHGSLMVHWKQQDCLHGNGAYVKGYTVKSCTGQRDCKCQHFTETNVSAETSSFTLRDLEEGLSVCVWVYPQGLTGSGPETMATPQAHVMEISEDSSRTTVTTVLVVVVVIAIVVAVFFTFMYRCRVIQKIKDWYAHRTEIHIPEMITINHQESTPLNEDYEPQTSGSSYPIAGYQRTDQMSGFTDTDGSSGDDPSANQIESQCTETTGLLSTGQGSGNVPMEHNQDSIQIVNEFHVNIPEQSESGEMDCTDEDNKCYSSKNTTKIENKHFSSSDVQSKMDTPTENHSLEVDFKDHHSSDCTMEDDSACRDVADDIKIGISSQEGSSMLDERTEDCSCSNSCSFKGYKDVGLMSFSNFEEVSDLDSGGAVGYKKTFSDSDLDSSSSSSMSIVGDDLLDTIQDPSKLKEDTKSTDTTLCKSLSSCDISQFSTVESPSNSAPNYMQAGVKKEEDSCNPKLLSKMAEKHDIQLNDRSCVINGHVNRSAECIL